MVETRVVETDDGVQYKIESNLVIGRSQFFHALFLINEKPVVVVNLKSSIFDMVLNYICTDEIDLNSMNVCDLLEAAEYLMMADLFEEVRRKIPRLICSGNCINLFNIAMKVDHIDILKLCFFYIWYNLEGTLKYSDISYLSFRYLKNFLIGNYLDVGTEVTVWNALMEWVEKDMRNRLECVPSLLKCLKLEDYSENCIHFISSHPYVLENKHCKSIISKLNLGSGDIENLKTNFVSAVRYGCKMDRNRVYHPHILVCGYLSTHSEDDRRFYIGLSVFIDEFRTRPKKYIGLNMIPSTLIYCDQRIYIYNDNDFFFSSYHLLDWEAKKLNRPPFHNRKYTIIEKTGNLYAVWIDSQKETLYVAFYNAPLDEWNISQGIPLQRPDRVSHILGVSVGGLIYTIFGVEHPSDGNLSFGKIYDPVADTWSELEMPLSHRSPCEMVAYDTVLVLLEGKVWQAKIYNPGNRTWTVLLQMFPCPYVYPRAVVINGRLIIYEQYGVQPASAPIYWDKEKNQWQNATALFRPPMLYCVITDETIIRKHYRTLVDHEWSAILREWK